MSLVHLGTGLDVSSILGSGIKSMLDNMGGNIEEVGTKDVTIACEWEMLDSTMDIDVVEEGERIEIEEMMKVQLVFILEMLILPIEMEGHIVYPFAPVGCILVPIGLVRESAIHGIVAERNIGSEDDVWESGILVIRGDAHLDVGQAFDNVKWEDIAVKSSDTLEATGLEGAIVHSVAEMFELDTRVDRTIGLVNGILMHDDDAWTSLRSGITCNGTDGDIVQLVVIDASPFWIQS